MDAVVRPSGCRTSASTLSTPAQCLCLPSVWGKIMLPAVMEMVNGVKLPPTILVPAQIVTKANDNLC